MLGILDLTNTLQLSLANPSPSRLRVKPHRMAVTAAILSNNATRLYTAGKEGGIACSDVSTGKRLSYTPKSRPRSQSNTTKGKGKSKLTALADEGNGHSDEIFALAISGDGKYLASGGKDKRVCVWDVDEQTETRGDEKKKEKEMVWVKGFVGHKDGISVCEFPYAQQAKDPDVCLPRVYLFENQQTCCIPRPWTGQSSSLIFLQASWAMSKLYSDIRTLSQD
jgi:WD40 repeat protein